MTGGPRALWAPLGAVLASTAFLLWLSAGDLFGGSRLEKQLTPTLGESKSLLRQEFIHPAMGTLFQVVVFAGSRREVVEASEQAFRRIDDLDNALSDYKSDSELRRLCERANADAFPVSLDLFAVVQRSLDISEATEGAFDASVGPLSRLWRASRRNGRLPATDQLMNAISLVGYRRISLDKKARTIALGPGMQLDLGGIAKGYAAAEALDVLRRHGFSQAMVAASGDLALGAPPPGQSGWRVEIPWVADTGIIQNRSFFAANISVSTSGDTEQFVLIDGIRYSHILNPKTGVGCTHRRLVTVVGRDGALVDGLATAFSVDTRLSAQCVLEKLKEDCQMLVQEISEKGPSKKKVFGPALSWVDQAIQ